MVTLRNDEVATIRGRQDVGFCAGAGAEEELDSRALRAKRYLCRRRPNNELHSFPSLGIAKVMYTSSRDSGDVG